MSDTRPPRMSRWLLERFTHPDDRRFVISDLADGFERRARESETGARRWYRRQVLRSLAPALASRWARRRRGLLAGLSEDLRYGARGLAATPVVTAVAIVSLTVGVAAVTSVFNIANALLVRPLSGSMEEPDRLVAVFTSETSGGPYGRFSFPDYRDLAERSRTLAEAAVYRLGAVRLGDPRTGTRVFAEIVSGNYFDVLRVPMQDGRAFRPDETRVGAAERVVVISDRLWRDRFDRRADVVGSEMRIDGDPFTIVGVAPADLASMTLAVRVDVWVPVGIPGGVFLSDERELAARGQRDYGVLARLADEATMDAADAEVRVIADTLADAHGTVWLDADDRPRTMTVRAASAARVPPDAFPALASGVGIVLVATGLLLAVACANIAGVLLARAGRRSREIAVRLALGAERRRVARLVFAESLLLGLLAAPPALLLTRWWIRRFDSIPLPIGELEIPLDLSMDVRVPAFALLLGLVAAFGFGLGPALHAARTGVREALSSAARTRGGRSTQRLRRLLVAAQVAAALVFVVGAGVARGSFEELTELPWGVRPEGVALMSIRLPTELNPGSLPAIYRQLEAEVESEGAVADAALSTTVEGGQFVFGIAERVTVPERPDALPVLAPSNAVSGDYMQLLEIELLEGRPIGAEDDETTAPVAVVNASLARRLWGNDGAIGRRLLRQQREYEVVGVAANGRYVGVEGTEAPYMWISLPQNPLHRVMVLARGRPDVAAALPALRALRDHGEGDIIAVTAQPYLQLVNFQFGYLRILGRLLAWAGGFGLLLATFGLYGVVAWSVQQRRHELAIHQAVGATPREVVGIVLGDGLRLVIAGLVGGLVLVVPLTALLRAELGALGALDLGSVSLGAGIVLVIAAIAALVPARRATRIHPARALAAE